MTVSVLFEIQATEDEPIRALLDDVNSLPHWERELMIARVMRFRADQMAENAAGAIALRNAEVRRTERARVTRERNARAREAK